MRKNGELQTLVVDVVRVAGTVNAPLVAKTLGIAKKNAEHAIYRLRDKGILVGEDGQYSLVEGAIIGDLSGRAATARASTKHGHCVNRKLTPEYRAWKGIHQRCYDKNCEGYKNYGARRIDMCGRWEASFEAFLEDMGPKPSNRHSVDRGNNDAGYHCGHCADCVASGHERNGRWATNEEQSNNKRTSVKLTIDGVTKTITQWARANGVTWQNALKRVKNGWDPVRAVTEPSNIQPKLTVHGRTQTIPAWSAETGVAAGTIWARLKRGWSPEDAIGALLMLGGKTLAEHTANQHGDAGGGVGR